MKKSRWIWSFTAVLFLAAFAAAPCAWAADPIVIGVPTSTGFLEGKEGLKVVEMAVEEINAAGGVNVGRRKRPFVVESIDIRDAAPGVPVPEALLGLEKIILEKKPTALVVGPFRSEALMAGMDIIAKYKVPLLGTIAMSPASEAKDQRRAGKVQVHLPDLPQRQVPGEVPGRHHGLHQRAVRLQQGLHHEPGRGLGAQDRRDHDQGVL